MHLATPIAPPADPLPWVTAQMQRGLVFDRRRSDANRMRAALDVLTANVAALHDTHPYRVVLSKNLTTAGTSYDERLILVGSKPLNDDTLTDGQKAAVTMGLVLHEIGHVRWAAEYDRALEASPIGNSKVVGAISNLAADMHNERAAMDLFPGLAYAVEVAMWWVDKQQPDVTIDLTTVAGRANAALAACRYPWRLPADTPADWRSTWADWAARAEQAGSPEAHVAIVSEALAIIRDLPPEPETPTPPTPPADEPTQGDDEPGDESDDDDETGDPSPGDDGEPQDGDEPSDDDGGSDADDDEQGDDEGQPSGAGDDTDETGDDEGQDDGLDSDGDGDDASDQTGEGESGDESGEGEGDGDDADDGGDNDASDTSHADEPGDGGGMGSPADADPYDENSDDLLDSCPGDTARDWDDDRTQADINAQLLSERTSGTTFTYRHSSSRYDERKVVVAKKTSRGFNL